MLTAKTFLMMLPLVFVSVSSALAQANTEKESLKGVRVMHLVMEDFSQNALKMGLVKDRLQADMELRLRKRTLRVIIDPSVDTPYLYLNINVVKHSSGLYAISISVQFFQVGSFAFPKESKDLFASTWQDSVVVICEPRIAVSQTNIEVAWLVDHFIEDYLAVNPGRLIM